MIIATDIWPPWSSAEALTAWATFALAIGVFFAWSSARSAFALYVLESIPLITLEPIIKISLEERDKIVPRFVITRDTLGALIVASSPPGNGSRGLFVRVTNIGRSPAINLRLKLVVSLAVIAEGLEVPPQRADDWLHVGTVPANQSVLISIINALDIYVSVSLREGEYSPYPRRNRKVNTFGHPIIPIFQSDHMQQVNAVDWVADGSKGNAPPARQPDPSPPSE